MATQAQIEANRLNAQRSTGPRTSEGKARSAQNALRHGVRAQAILSAQFQVLGEDPQDFSALLHALVEDLRPQGPVEEMCVENIALGLWRQRRVLRAEMGNIALQQARLSDAVNSDEKVAAQASVGVPELDLLRALMRYESHLHRQIHYGFTKLTQVQTLRYVKATRDRLGQEPRIPTGFKEDVTTMIYDLYSARGEANAHRATPDPDVAAESEPAVPTQTTLERTQSYPDGLPPSVEGLLRFAESDRIGQPREVETENPASPERTHSPENRSDESPSAEGPLPSSEGTCPSAGGPRPTSPTPEEANESEPFGSSWVPTTDAQTNPIAPSPVPSPGLLPMTREIIDKKIALQQKSNGKSH